MMGHGGLRGLMALHVCVFHYLFGLSRWSPLHLNTQGNAHMPFFFLLSGFSLAAIYGADVMGQQHASTTITTTTTNNNNSSKLPSNIFLDFRSTRGPPSGLFLRRTGARSTGTFSLEIQLHRTFFIRSPVAPHIFH